MLANVGLAISWNCASREMNQSQFTISFAVKLSRLISLRQKQAKTGVLWRVEICNIFKYSRTTIYNWIKPGKLKTYKVKSNLSFLWNEIQAMLQV